VRYMLLVYGNETERGRVNDAECAAFAHSIVQSGHMMAGDPLESVSTATTVRVRNGKTTVTDGPFAETREQLGGYYIVEANDLDEAIGIAARIPVARYGSIEVRPIRKLSV
jgi:hypothetical protein